MFDLSPCRLGSRTSLGHCAYALHHCPQCAGAFAVCAVCEAPEVCPGCRHRTVLAQIAAGEVVFPEALGDPGEGTAPTAVGGGRAEVVVDQAGELTHGDFIVDAALVDQAVTLDAGSTAVYNPDRLRNAEVAPGLGDAAMASPVYVLVLPVVSHDLGPVLQALAPVLAGNGRTNGHVEEEGQRLPRHLARKCFLSDKQCPQGHTYKNTGKALRFLGNNQCVPCSGQRRPRRTAASTPAATEG